MQLCTWLNAMHIILELRGWDCEHRFTLSLFWGSVD